ncbi:MAG: type IV toxin-antitoxin system AbiEi family antitoxin domain-containing protein [Gemmatimonadota bacterium]
MSTPTYRKLYSIAEDQMGYVTAAQAAKVGVQNMTLVMMARRGSLERASHGVYRLVDYPTHPLAQYMQATLWPYDQRGILSHGTALSLYEMSDVNPAKVHITLPAGFRIQRRVEPYLAVHMADLPATDITAFEGMPITTPARSVRDAAAAHLGPALLAQAIDDGIRSGRLSPAVAKALRREMESAQRRSSLPPTAGGRRTRAARH